MPAAKRREPLTPEQSELVGSAAPLARWVARRMSRLAPWRFEEYRDAAIDGVMDAARDYDPARGSFPTFARRCALRSIKDRAKYVARICRSTVVLPIRPGHAVAWPRLPDESPDFEGLIAVLPERHREVIRLRYIEGLPQQRIADRVGCIREWAGKIERRALESIRERHKVA